MKEEILELLKAEAKAILNIPVDDSFEEAIQILHKHTHIKDGKIIVSGMGKAGQIAENIATTFSSTGSPAVFLHPADAQHGDLGIIRRNDVLLLISNSGKTREVIELFKLSRNLYQQLPVILITGNPEGDLAGEADITISTGSPKEVCPLGLTPTTSTTMMTVIGDILVVQMMKKIGFSSHDYALRHHGGYLGHKSRIAASLHSKNKSKTDRKK
jgi:arabinose-5-phosphate isomerase